MHTNIFKSDLVKSAHFVGKYDFPMLKMTESIPAEIVPFDSVNKNDTKKWIHFYIDDCKFERIYIP